MAEFEGLAFYNAGTVAGASQRHKHLQMVPLPLGPGPAPTPMDAFLGSARLEDPIGVAPGLHFSMSSERLCPTKMSFFRKANVSLTAEM